MELFSNLNDTFELESHRIFPYGCRHQKVPGKVLKFFENKKNIRYHSIGPNKHEKKTFCDDLSSRAFGFNNGVSRIIHQHEQVDTT